MKKIMLLSALLLVPHQFFGKAKKPAEPTSVQLSTGQFLALTLSPWAAAAVLAFVVKKYWDKERSAMLWRDFPRVETKEQLGSMDELGEPLTQTEPPSILNTKLQTASATLLGNSPNNSKDTLNPPIATVPDLQKNMPKPESLP